MRKTIARLTLLIGAAVFIAAPTASFGEAAAGYEIKDADRGTVRRVKVTYDGQKIATITFSRGRTASSAYCCTPDGCQEIVAGASCTTFKMTCDKDGVCRRG